jgi:ABC-type uncharacterized transport system permease subunit
MYYAVRLLNTLLPLCYAAGVVAYGADFFGDVPAAAAAARRVMSATLALHATFLVTLGLYEGHLPLSSPPEVLTFVAFAVACIYVLLERVTGVDRTGLFLVALPLLLQVAGSAFLEFRTPFPAILRSPLFAIHTIAGVSGYAAFGVSAVYGCLYLLLHRALKAARFGLVFDRLPPLDLLARMSLGAVRVGVALLTVTIFFGTLWAARAVRGFAADPKFLLTVLVWAAYLSGLLLHRFLGWTERRTIGGFLVGFVLLVAAALASRLFFATFHAFA